MGHLNEAAGETAMDVLYLLVPMSVVLVFLVMGLFAWALQSGQFDDLEREGGRIFSSADSSPVDEDQGASRPVSEE